LEAAQSAKQRNQVVILLKRLTRRELEGRVNAEERDSWPSALLLLREDDLEESKGLGRRY
jgi:hypothetical protein